jgi:RHS repeat-associated protein
MKLSLKVFFAAIISLVCLGVSSVLAQEDPNIGLQKNYAPFQYSEIDQVNLSNGALSVDIPLLSYPQRGKLKMNLVLHFGARGFFETNVCAPGLACVYQWFENPDDFRIINASSRYVIISHNSYEVGNDAWLYPVTYYMYGVKDSHGFHRLGKLSSGTWYSTDGTGYSLSPSGILTDSDGIISTTPTSSADGYQKDTNGNTITLLYPHTFFLSFPDVFTGAIDTLGRSIPAPTTATDTSGCQGPLPVTSAMIWNAPGVNGGIFAVKLCYASIHLQYGTNNPPIYQPLSTDIAVLQSAVLPNGTAWTFSYTTDGQGNLSQITYPSGATMSYVYGGGLGCMMGAQIGFTPGVRQRTLDLRDGTSPKTWTYTWGGSGTRGSTTDPPVRSVVITDPNLNDAVHISTGMGGTCSFYETQVRYYNGSQAANHLLQTVDTQYMTTSGPPLDPFPGLIYGAFPISEKVTLDTGEQSQRVWTYDSGFTYLHPDPLQSTTYTALYGNVSTRTNYDYGQNGVGGILNREAFLYKAFDGSSGSANYKYNNLVRLLSSRIVYDSSGNTCQGTSAPCSKTLFGYDESNLQSSGVTVQHVVGVGYPGNPTSVSRWLNGSVTAQTNCNVSVSNGYLVTTKVYFDTGEVQKHTDPCGHSTTFQYSSAYYGAFPTTTTNVLNQSTNYGYDLNSGVVTSIQDRNQQSTTRSYDFMGRPTQITYPDGGSTSYCYTDLGGVTCAQSGPPFQVVTTRLASPSPSITMTTVYDGLGRVAQTQMNSDSEGTDYIDTAYDGVDRVASVSNPHRISSLSTDGTAAYAYDALDRTTFVNEQDGSVISMSYSGRCSTVTDPAGKSRKSCSDALDRLTQVTEDPSGLGYVTIYANNALNNLTGVVQNGSRQRTFTYDSLSRLTQAINPESGTISYAYDADGNVLTKVAPATNLASTSGKGSGTVSGSEQSTTNSATHSTGTFTIWGGAPQTSGGPILLSVNGSVIAGVGYGSTSTTASVASALTTTINGNSTSPVTATVNGSAITITSKATGSATNYIMSGTPTSISPPNQTMAVAASGSTMTGGKDAGTTYDSGTVWITVNGVKTSVSYGQSSTATTLANGLISAINANSSVPVTASLSGATVNLVAKTTGASTNYSLASGSSGTFSPPSFSVSVSGSLLTGGADPSGATVTTAYAYDALNRLMQKSFSDGVTPAVIYAYDGVAPLGCTLPTLTINNGIGRRTGMCDGVGSEAWTYDSMGRPLIDQRTTNSVTKSTSYTYNLNGSVATLTYPSGSVITYTPNAAGQTLSAVDLANSINYATNAHYAPQGALAAVLNGANLASSFVFNNRLQPCWMYATTGVALPWNTTLCNGTFATGNVLDLKYDFSLGVSDNGNVASITNNRDITRSQFFTYDVMNRISNAQTQTTGVTIPNSNCWGLAFGYDPWGNLLQSSTTGPAGCGEPLPLNVTVNPSNRIAYNNILSQIVNYCYDSAGNLIYITQGAASPGIPCPTSGPYQYTYDAENHLVSTAGVTYTYDGDGKRVMKSSGKIYWYGTGSDPLDETDLTGNANNSSFNEYIFFNGKRIARRDSSNNVSYYFADHLGTARIVTNAAGNVLDDSDFYPFGGERSVLSSSGNNYKFTGKERDSESGLDNFGARYNASTIGRWMSPDAINITDGRVLNPANTINKYIYGGNNPLKYSDPDGRDITVFYTETGRAGHFWMVAYDQSTGNSAVMDFGPQNGDSRATQAEEAAGMDVPGDVNYQNHMSADEMRQDYSSLTIQTNPEDAQKAIQAINTTNSANPNYNLYSSNCTTVCRDVLKKILKLNSASIRPKSLWGDIFKKWSKQALMQPPKSKPPTVQSKHGTDYGQPRYPTNTFEFLWLILHPLKACVTTFGPRGPYTTCE